MRFLLLTFLLSPIVWNQSVKQEFKSEQSKWLIGKQTYDSVYTIFKQQNDSCAFLSIDVHGYGADYIRRSNENKDLAIYRYKSYKTELNRKSDYAFNHLADSSVNRITEYTTNMRELIEAQLYDSEFRELIWQQADTSDLSEKRKNTETLMALKTKNDRLQKAIEQNLEQLAELNRLCTVYASKLDVLHAIWDQYEKDSRNFEMYVFYMKNRLESLNATPSKGAQPRPN